MKWDQVTERKPQPWLVGVRAAHFAFLRTRAKEEG